MGRYLRTNFIIVVVAFVATIASETKADSTTFRVCNKTLEAVRGYGIQGAFANSSKQLIQDLRQYEKNNGTEVLQASSFPINSIGSQNGFVHTVVNAYKGHHNLVIKPDHVWAAVITQFSFYVNKNAEKFRGKFVNFEGKKELSVTVSGSLRTAPYDFVVKLMTEQIDKNLVDPQVKKWVLPNFSTTTKNDIISVGVVFMATMKKYFSYKSFLACAIPEITLEGTTEDWKDILGRIEKLKEYELKEWHSMLQPVIQQFVNAKEGNVDETFWKAIVHRWSGSGESEISGWISTFCVFDVEGNWNGDIKESWSKGSWKFANKPEVRKWPKIAISDIPSGIVEVDMKIEELGGGTYNSVLFGGHMATEARDNVTLVPALGWAIVLKQD